MKQRLRRFAAWMIVLMTGALIASWIVSYWWPHGYYITALRRYGVWCDSGMIYFRYGVKTELDFTEPGRWTVREVGYKGKPTGAGPGSASIDWGRHGPRIIVAQWPPFQEGFFAVGGEVPTIEGRMEFFGERVRMWGLAHWMPVAVLMPLIALILLRWWRRRIENRIARGLCARCGYDLRASPDRCPECGEIRTGSPARSAPAT